RAAAEVVLALHEGEHDLAALAFLAGAQGGAPAVAETHQLAGSAPTEPARQPAGGQQGSAASAAARICGGSKRDFDLFDRFERLQRGWLIEKLGYQLAPDEQARPGDVVDVAHVLAGGV